MKREAHTQLSQQRRGTVSVEYALVIAAVIAVVLMSVSVVGDRVDRTLKSASAFRGDTSAQAASAAGQTKHAVAAQHTSVAHNRGVSEWVVAGQTLAMLAIITWVLLERRKRLRQLDEENAVAEPLFTENKGKHVFAKRQQIFKILSHNLDALLGSQIQVRHLMSDRVTSVQPTLAADAVRELMNEKHIRHVLVVDKQNKLVGIISDRDLNKDHVKTARDLMTADPIQVEASSLVNPAITQMMKRRISALPVTIDGELQGVLTTTDLMMALQCCLQVLQSVAESSGTQAPIPDSTPNSPTSGSSSLRGGPAVAPSTPALPLGGLIDNSADLTPLA
ncbi:MAG: CBS domain-containing protein [Planctomycetales bacterium]|nr:CBS domain-containing protein [Planctomycetales bacterium]